MNRCLTIQLGQFGSGINRTLPTRRPTGKYWLLQYHCQCKLQLWQCSRPHQFRAKQIHSLHLPPGKKVGSVPSGARHAAVLCKLAAPPFNTMERVLRINMQTLKAQSISAGRNCGCFATRQEQHGRNNKVGPNWAISVDGFCQAWPRFCQKQIKCISFASTENDVASLGNVWAQGR